MTPSYRTEQALLDAYWRPPGRSAVRIMGEDMGGSARLAGSVPEIPKRSIGGISCLYLVSFVSSQYKSCASLMS